MLKNQAKDGDSKLVPAPIKQKRAIKDCNELLEIVVDTRTYQYAMHFQGKVATNLIRSSRCRVPF